LEHFLVAALHHDRDLFAKRFVELARHNAMGLLGILRTNNGLAYLLSQMQTHNCVALVFSMVFSDHGGTRQVGLYLFDHLGIDSFSTEELAATTDTQVRIAVFEFQRARFRAQSIVRFLLALLPRIEKANTSIQAEFEEELLLQAKNYAQACQSVLKKMRPKPKIVERVVKKANDYFTAFWQTRNKEINSMQVPQFEHVARTRLREVRREIHEQSREGSIWMQFVQEVEMIYGDRFSSFLEGELSSPTPLQEHTVSMEIPRIAAMDPELMAMRLWHAGIIITEIEQKSTAISQNKAEA
jgi:hypothetical protein